MRITILSAACAVLLLASAPAAAQIKMNIKLPGMDAGVNVDDGTGKKADAPKAAEAPKGAALTAKMDGDTITVSDGRIFKVQQQKLMMPYPEIEVKDPNGAKVSFGYGTSVLFEDEAPCVWKEARIDEYVKMTVTDSVGTWSVKFVPIKQVRMVIVAGAAAPAAKVAAEPAKPAEPAAKPAGNMKVITAKLDGNTITLGDGRVFTLKQQKLLMPYPHIEVLEPVGAKVSFSYGAAAVFSDEAPCLWKEPKIDEYVKMTITEDDATWSVKFVPAKQMQTTLVSGTGGASVKAEVKAEVKVEVKAAEPPPPVVAANPHLKLAKTLYKAGDAVDLQWHDMPANSSAWVTIVKKGAPANEWGDWTYTSSKPSGVHTVDGLAPGDYEARAFFESFGGVRDRLEFKVVP